MKLAADPVQNHILQMAAAGSLAFADDLQAQILRRVSPLRRANAPDYELIKAARETLVETAPALARLHRDARLAALVTGAASAGMGLPPDRDPPGPPPFGEWEWDGGREWLPLVDAAVVYLQDRHLLLRDEWEKLKAQAETEGRALAELAARDAEAKITQALIRAVRDGGTATEFKADLRDEIDTSSLGPGTLEGVFRTGTGAAYNVGYEILMDDPIVADMIPFDENEGIDDSRQTELCGIIAVSGIQGTGIFLRDDPVWQHYKPLRHFNCRCSRRGVTVLEAARRGIVFAQKWLETGRRPLDGFVKWPAVSLPKGWTPGGRL